LVTSCIGTAFYNTLLKENYREGKKWREDEDEDVSSCWMTLKKERILVIERGSPRSSSVENSLWKRLWTFRKTYVRMNE